MSDVQPTDSTPDPVGNHAVVENGIVTNVVVSSASHSVDQGWIDLTGVDPQPGIGWSYDGTTTPPTWTPPAPSAPTPQQAAATKLQSMAATDVPAFSQQIATDVQTITSSGWASLDAQTQHDIMLRVVNGFGTVLTAIQTHGVATGVLPPS